MPLIPRLAGHAYSVLPTLWAQLRPERAPAPVARFSATVADPLLGPVKLSGCLADRAGSDTLLVILHGLSGSAESSYCVRASRAAHRAGLASLRLSARGSDRSGEDFAHGGLTDDLRAALGEADLRRFRRVVLLGYSVGGHVALRAAALRVDPRIAAVAAVGAPLDLDAASAAFEAPELALYRRHIFAGLDEIYAAVAARRGVPTPVEVVRRARTCRERDELTVVRRFGFRDAADYYAQASVSGLLGALEVPALLVAARHDPIIPPATLERALAAASPALAVRWLERGGHVHFPRDADLGESAPRGVEAQVIAWLLRQVA